MTVKYELIKGGKVPSKGTDESAGWDLSARLESSKIFIPSHEWVAIGLGVRIQPPKGYHSELFLRSGMSRRGLRLTTGVSVIDEDYRGEIIACIYNESGLNQTIYNGDRICQLVFRKTPQIEWEEGTLDDTQRGEGGFGSTGRR